MMSVFEARNISRSFGSIQALRDVSVSLVPGEVHAIIGENGAGKSTLMNIICGKLKPNSGELLRNGLNVKFDSPRDAQSAGICIAPQEISLVGELSVAENVMLGHHPVGTGGVIDWKQTFAKAERQLHAIDRSINPNSRASNLNKAQQQLVQIARAASANPQILILDEPTASLSNRETQRLFDFIEGFVRSQNSILYISHRLDEVIELSQRVTVLRDGCHVAELRSKEASKSDLVKLMAGHDVFARRRLVDDTKPQEAVLRVTNLTRKQEFRNISFELHRGEVLGFAGLVGAGRTELAKCIFGLTQPEGGDIQLFGKTIAFSHPSEAIKQGLVYLPEERKQEGIFSLLSIAENMSIASHDRFSSRIGLRFGKIRKAVDENVSKLKIKVGNVSDAIISLSGGNQQKVIIARWLMKESRILILDEPTRGIDVGAKAEIMLVLRQLTEAGLTVIYISSELQELLDVSDRIVVMHEGYIKGIVSTKSATQESLLALAMS
jgi:ribose transport system ATP-binding protein